MTIPQALSQLDPSNDDHWTGDGAPRVDVVQKLTGLSSLTRAQIVEAAPKFTRDVPTLPERAPKPSPAKDDASETQRYVEIDAELAKLHAQKGEIENRMGELSAEQARLARFAPKPVEYDHKADQEARMVWLESQKRQRAERAHRTRALIEATAAGAAGPAPIDAAMARRNTRGTQRPTFPVPQGASGG